MHCCLPSNSLCYFFFATILSGPYLWNRYSQRLQIECAAWSCSLILHCCLPSNSLSFFLFFFPHHDFFFSAIFFFFFLPRFFFFADFFFFLPRFFFFFADFFFFFFIYFFFLPRFFFCCCCCRDFFLFFFIYIYFFSATILSGPFASLISSLINIISLLLTMFDWTKVRGIAPRSRTGRQRTCLVIISDPRRGCFMELLKFIFFPPRSCPGHISGTVTRRDSRLSVLLGPAV